MTHKPKGAPSLSHTLLSSVPSITTKKVGNTMLPQKPSGGRITAGQFPQPPRKSHNVEFLVFLVAMTCILTQGAMTFLAASTVSHQVEHRITEVTSYE